MHVLRKLNISKFNMVMHFMMYEIRWKYYPCWQIQELMVVKKFGEVLK